MPSCEEMLANCCIISKLLKCLVCGHISGVLVAFDKFHMQISFNQIFLPY